MDRHQPSAAEWTDIWPPVFIQGQIPSRNRAATVAQNLSKGFAPIGSIASVVGIGIVRSPLGPIHLRLRICTVNAIDPFRLPNIPVPSDGVSVITYARRFQFSHRTAPQIIVVVNQPDLG